MKNFTKNITILTALTISAISGFFSVFGISKLFYGAGVIQVIIMASSLEFGKIVTVSFLKQNWRKISILIKFYLSFSTIILMIITSSGTYSFLANGYQKTANKFEIVEKRIEIIDNKENLIKQEIQRYEAQTNQKSEFIKTQQGFTNSIIDKTNSARVAQRSINQNNQSINNANDEIKDLNSKINVLNDSIGSFENQKLELSSSDVAAEIGPLKYISNLTGQPMDKVVNWFILMLVVVFDPLAIALLIASQSIKNESEKEENKEVSKEENKEVSKEVLGNNLLERLKELENYFKNHSNKSEPIFSSEPPKVELKEKDIKEEIQTKEIQTDSTQNNFEKYYEAQISNMNRYKTKFEELLFILYDGGKVEAGENLLNFIDFKNKLDELFEQKFSNEEIKRFLAVCNYLKITSLNDGERKALVGFDGAKKNLEVFYNNK